jgi:hypothetical protein
LLAVLAVTFGCHRVVEGKIPMADVMPQQKPIRSLIPARLDRLGWSSFHTRMVCGLGAAWIMMIGGVVELLIGINAEGKSLEAVTNHSPPPTPSL